MRVEAETGVMQTEAKEHLEPPEARRLKEGSFPEPLEVVGP